MFAFLLPLLSAAVTTIGILVLVHHGCSLLTRLENCGKHSVKAPKSPSAAVSGFYRYPVGLKHVAWSLPLPYITLLGTSYRVSLPQSSLTLVLSRDAVAAFFSRLTLYFPQVIDTLCSTLSGVQGSSYTELSARGGKLFTASTLTYGGEEI